MLSYALYIRRSQIRNRLHEPKPTSFGKFASNFRGANTEKKHHQNTRSYSKRQFEMKEKLTSVLRQSNVIFDQEMGSEMHNFITKQVFPEDVKKDVLSADRIGKEECNKFVSQRLSVSIWAPITKMKLKLCLTANKRTKTKIEDKLVESQGQRLLFSRCAIVASSDRDLDMASVVGDYVISSRINIQQLSSDSY